MVYYMLGAAAATPGDSAACGSAASSSVLGVACCPFVRSASLALRAAAAARRLAVGRRRMVASCSGWPGHAHEEEEEGEGGGWLESGSGASPLRNSGLAKAATFGSALLKPYAGVWHGAMA